MEAEIDMEQTLHDAEEGWELYLAQRQALARRVRELEALLEARGIGISPMAYHDATQARDALARRAYRAEAALAPIVAAWRNAGPVPRAHRLAQRRLLRDWPTLANALISAAPPTVGTD